MINFIKEVENKYNVSSITVNGVQVWPFLRTAYYFKYNEFYKFSELNRNKSKNIFAKLKRVKNVFYGLENLTRKYDYLILSDTFEKRLIDNKYIDKIAEYLMFELGKDNVLLIENPANGVHYKRSEISINNIISLDLFQVFCYPRLLSKRLDINNEQILKEINRTYQLDINYLILISSFFCYAKWFDFFYKIYNPKIIFINCYYSLPHQAAIFSANKIGIKTVELQHGIINNKHPAYNVFVKIDKSFFPNYLFVFGDYVKTFFNENNYFIEKDNVLSIGNLYLDYICNEYKPSEMVTKLLNDFRIKYKKIVAISSQWTVEGRLIDFLKKSASLSKDILYIFVPRDLSKDYSRANFPENIIILRNLNIYQIVKEADFHATVNSTCALEAPVLGVPNILININNQAKIYYSDLLTNRNVTRFVDKENEFVNLILNWQTNSKKEINNLHRGFYKENHKENLKQALRIVMENISLAEELK